MPALAHRIVACCVMLNNCAIAGDEKPEAPSIAGDTMVSNFDATAVGTLPNGWRIATTQPDGPDAAWHVRHDPAAPSGDRALSLTTINHHSGSAFNICWAGGASFRDGTVEVKVRADGGDEDQGGGPIWRVLDASNYYVARYNPLENNFRLYVVHDGRRRQLADASGLDVKAGEWFTIRVSHTGNQIDCRLNGQELLHATDGTIADAGGVGVWTKADAASSFDDLVISGTKASDASP